MVFTFLVFLHLIATCAAIGTIVVTDMRLAAKMMGYRVVIPRPERFETVMVSASLALLYLTGIALVAVALSDRPDYLTNGKLQAKLVLVGLLTLNAFILHFMAFPILALSWPVSEWTRSQWFTVAASVSLSNSLWFFCAFLGVARIWNFTVSAGYVLAVAAVVWTVVYLLVNLALKLGSRDAPRQQPDWVDCDAERLCPPGGGPRPAAADRHAEPERQPAQLRPAPDGPPRGRPGRPAPRAARLTSRSRAARRPGDRRTGGPQSDCCKLPDHNRGLCRIHNFPGDTP